MPLSLMFLIKHNLYFHSLSLFSIRSLASTLKTHTGQRKKVKEQGKPVNLAPPERQWIPAIPSLTRWHLTGRSPSSCSHLLISEGPGWARLTSFMKLSHVGPSNASVWGGLRAQQTARNTQTYSNWASGRGGQSSMDLTPQYLKRGTRAGAERAELRWLIARPAAPRPKKPGGG